MDQQQPRAGCFDTYAAIINVSDGTESARYDYGGATLQSVSIGGRSTALLLAVRGGDTLVTLDDSLNQLASVAAGRLQASAVPQRRSIC